MSSEPPSGRGRVRRALLLATAALSFLLAAGSATAFAAYEWVGYEIRAHGIVLGHEGATPSVSPSPGSSPAAEVGGVCKDTCNYLVLGSDSRASLSQKEQQGFQSNAEIGGYRSDTIILVHIDGLMKHAAIVSFPRDTMVDIPGYGVNKINAAFNLGSLNGGGVDGAANLAAKTVQGLTGLHINHVVVVDLAGFQDLVKAVGGVDFCTPIPLKDDPQAYGDAPPEDLGSGLNLPHAGCYVLDGPTALALVRARNVVSNGELVDCVSDFSRISRQQQFMRGLLNKLVSPSMVTQLPSLVPAVTHAVTFDTDVRPSDLVDLANAMKGVASGNADFRTLPTELGWATIDGFRASVLNITSQGKEFLRRLGANEPLGDLGTELTGEPPSPADIAVRVYDDASEGRAQNDVYNAQLRQFKKMALFAESASPALQGVGTTILYNKGYLEEAKVVANYVPGNYPIKQAEPGQLPLDTQVGVVVAADYTYHDVGWGKPPSVAVNCPYHR